VPRYRPTPFEGRATPPTASPGDVGIGCGSRGRPSGGGVVAELVCRCGLPLDPPRGEGSWRPCCDPEPDMGVRAVALVGQDAAFLRSVRTSDGWHTEGLGAAHPESSPSRGWGDVGRCWAGEQHPVVDVSDWLAQHPAPETVRPDKRRPATAGRQSSGRDADRGWTRLPTAGAVVPIVVHLPGDRERQ